jgi:hypothetical protein
VVIEPVGEVTHGAEGALCAGIRLDLDVLPPGGRELEQGDGLHLHEEGGGGLVDDVVFPDVVGQRVAKQLEDVVEIQPVPRLDVHQHVPPVLIEDEQVEGPPVPQTQVEHLSLGEQDPRSLVSQPVLVLGEVGGLVGWGQGGHEARRCAGMDPDTEVRRPVALGAARLAHRFLRVIDGCAPHGREDVDGTFDVLGHDPVVERERDAHDPAQ